MRSSGSEPNAQLLKGALDIAILAALSTGESYGYAIVATLADAGLSDVAEASIYGTLRRLESNGALASKLAASPNGPARRYYRLTARGRRLLATSARQWTWLNTAMHTILTNSGVVDAGT